MSQSPLEPTGDEDYDKMQRDLGLQAEVDEDAPAAEADDVVDEEPDETEEDEDV